MTAPTPERPPLSYAQTQMVRVFVALSFAGPGGLSRADLRSVVGSSDLPAHNSTVSRVCEAMVSAGYVRKCLRGDLPREPVYYVAPREAWQGRAGGWVRSYSDWLAKKRAKGQM